MTGDYFLHLGVLICIYTLLSQSLDLAAGRTGLVSLAHAGFYGIGAYTTALLAVHFDKPLWISLPIAMAISGVIALLVSFVALRTINDYFIMCTLGVQVVIFSIMNNWMKLTRGPLGISSIPPIHFLDSKISSKTSFLFISFVFMAMVWWLLRNLSNSGFGKTLTAISEDEIYTQSIGKNVYLSKIIAFTLSAMFAAIPGALYAHYTSYIDPSSFTLNESIFILAIVIIGGVGNLKGSFLASVFMVLLPEMLRFVGMPNSKAANIRQIIYGVILVIVVMRGSNGVSDLFAGRTKPTES